MSYYVIYGPLCDDGTYAGQRLGEQVVDGFDYGCPQWRCSKREGKRFSTPTEARAYLAAAGPKYTGKIVKVRTSDDLKAERKALLKVETAARERWIVWTRRTYEALGEAFAELDALRSAAQHKSEEQTNKGDASK